MADNSTGVDVGSSEAAMAAGPIAFDSAEQLDEVLERIWTALDGHIQDKCNEMARSTGHSDTTSLRRMIDEELRARLPGYIQQNITVRGMSWEEHQQKAHMATQPVDSALLRATIQAQDAAVAMSNLSCATRINKPALLTTQVDTRIGRVVKSGEDKSGVLDEQRKRREARRRVIGGEVTAKEQTTRDLQTSEALLQAAVQAMERQSEKADRAASVTADVQRLAASRRL